MGAVGGIGTIGSGVGSVGIGTTGSVGPEPHGGGGTAGFDGGIIASVAAHPGFTGANPANVLLMVFAVSVAVITSAECDP